MSLPRSQMSRNGESRLGEAEPAHRNCRQVQTFRDYLLKKQATAQAKAAGTNFEIDDRYSGAAYVLRAMERAISHFYKRDDGKNTEVDLLD